MTDEPPILLEVCHVIKKFGDFLANENVNLRVREGEIHAILGENGAGKSTLVKIIYGALAPDDGEIRWKGSIAQIANPKTARELGIGMVFQHFSLFESMTVAENILLALPKVGSIKKISERIRELSSDYGLLINPDSIVADLSVGEKQRIEIVRCLLQNPSLLIMDEPTSVLTPQEANNLTETLQRLSQEGCAILYISHRLEEVQKLCHFATILRHGKVVANCVPQEETPARLARLMVGENIKPLEVSKTSEELGEEKLRISDLSLAKTSEFSIPLNNINLCVNAGELVAIAGVAGNGQSELFEVISGEKVVQDREAVSVNGKFCGNDGISARRKLEAAFVPEERHGHAAVSNMDLSQNTILTWHSVDRSIVRFKIVSHTDALQTSRRIVKQFDVRISHDNPESSSLSGGNLQKFVVGRELIRRPKVLVVNQPTWGVDVGAASVIRRALIDLAREGSAVLVISQDLDEILEMADRIAVISNGNLSEAIPKNQLSLEKIGLLMGGHD